MRAPKPKYSRRARRRTLRLVLQLIICFPLGLYTMWTKTRWPRLVKTAVSAVVVTGLLAILLPMTDPPERVIGGIHLIDETPNVEVFGPEAPANREIIEIYAPRRTAVILEPTPTPEPIIVYCNNGGRYYHTEFCHYVKDTTPNVTLARAAAAGYTRCLECDAPEFTN